MNIMQQALRKAEVITDNDLERVKRQERIERERARKRRERKKARVDNAKRARIKKICKDWVDLKWSNETREVRETIARRAFDSLTERDIEKYSFREVAHVETIIEGYARKTSAVAKGETKLLSDRG